MKKLFFTMTLFAAIGIQSVSAQSTVPLSNVLTGYYSLKDALVAGDATNVAVTARALLQTLNSVDVKALPEKDQKAFKATQEKLAFDARHISESSDINHQREHFVPLSGNMASLAKQAHLSQEPIYEDYCPMKKAYWLSNEAAIKNPYYGNSMLTCGKVTTTLKP
jgi:hypothetical protein